MGYTQDPYKTVDGRNAKQPPGMYKTPVKFGINYHASSDFSDF